MKNLFAILFLFAIVAGSCTKEYHNPTTVDNGNNNNNGGGGNGGGGGGGNGGGGGGGGSNISAVPSTFTQKVLVEEVTGEWCGFCPDGLLKLEDAENSAPGKIYGASIHNQDPFTLTPFDPDFETLLSDPNDPYGGPGYPQASVNRIPQGGRVWLDRPWTGAAAMQLANTAVCGLAMKSYTKTGDSLFVEVHCGFNTVLTGDYRLTIYLLENEVPAIAQHNYYDDGSYGPGPLVGIGNPIVDWVHNDVVRLILTDEFGDVIPAANMIPGGEFVANYKCKYTGYVKDNLRITAFVNKYGADYSTHQVMNVQQAKVSILKDWD